MRAPLSLVLILVAVALPLLRAPAHATSKTERLEAAVAAYPDDPELAWALAHRLAEDDRMPEAVGLLEAHLERWPDRRPDADLTLGRWLYDLGRDEAAVRHLERAVARNPVSGAARFHLALALKRLGRHEQAGAHFRFAENLVPELRSEALLLRALMRLETGDVAGGESLLRDSTHLDPTGEPAESARLVLGESAPLRPPRIQLEAWSGAAYDSNVILEGRTVSLAPDRDDVRFDWGTAITAHPLSTDSGGVSLGYRYDRADHAKLDEFDTQSHLAFVSGRWRASRATTLRLDGFFRYSSLDDDPYLLVSRLSPSLFVALGPRAGVTRLFLEGLWLAYDDSPFVTSLERDGWSYGGGFEHTIPLPRWRGAWAQVGASFLRMDTEGGVDSLGFDSAYDHDRWRAALHFGLPLWWRLRSDLFVSVGHERYANKNLIDFLNGGGIDPATASRRRDFVSELGVRLIRPIARFADIEISYRYRDRSSNVAFYDYDRSTVGLLLRLHSL
ncbi:MAG: tetratricopeptide repeat protein [Myxococcota bacterium]